MSFKKIKLIIGIIFFSVIIFWISGLCTYVKNVSITKYGTETVATVTGKGSDTVINNEQIYYLNFTFTDKAGGMHSGRTDSYLMEFEANQYVSGEKQLRIKYNSEFKAVRADYKFGTQFELFFMPIFWIVKSAGRRTAASFTTSFCREAEGSSAVSTTLYPSGV